MSVAWHSEETGGGGRRRRPRLAGCRLTSTESLTDVCSGGLRWSWAPRLLFVWALHIINQLYQKKKPAWNFGRAYTRARTRWQPAGHKRRVMAASRAPLLIAAADSPLLIESMLIHRCWSAAADRRCSSQWEHFHRSAAERLSSVPGAAAEPRQFQQSRPTGQEVK